MTMEGITFNLGFGTSPFVVTINDTSGLAPLELPRAFVADRHLPQPPSDDAICRFEAALSAGAIRGVRGTRAPAALPEEAAVAAGAAAAAAAAAAADGV